MNDDELLRTVDREVAAAEKTIRTSQPKTACPACGCRQSRVTDSRVYETYGASYYRRRVCLGCGVHYRTEEVARAVISDKKFA